MIEIDLITGFLGAGKTTFIKKYAEYLVGQGYKLGIIENDFGAVNVDMLMLQDILGEQVDVEQIVGGSVVSDWKRRFRTKLISMAMRGFNRVIVEPSGIYDVDAFFDVLGDEPVDSWYRAGNIFMIMDAGTEENLSKEEEYLLVSQAANAGKIIFSKVQENTPNQIAGTIDHLNRILGEFKCPRRFCSDSATSQTPNDVILAKPWDELTAEDFDSLSQSGWIRCDHEKLWFDQKKAFSSLFFMHPQVSAEKLPEILKKLFSDESCGTIYRIKGYLPLPNGTWLQLNATPQHTSQAVVSAGQEIIIVIGQDLKEEQIRPYWFS